MINIKKERKAFLAAYPFCNNKKYLFDEQRNQFYAKIYQVDSSDLMLDVIEANMLWGAWLKCAESKQAEIEHLKAKLTNVEAICDKHYPRDCYASDVQTDLYLILGYKPKRGAGQ